MQKIISFGALRFNKVVFDHTSALFATVPVKYHIASYSSENNNEKNGSELPNVSKFRSQDGVFNPARVHEVFQNPVENATCKEQSSQYRYSDSAQVNEDDKEHISAYNMQQNVSLSAVMQSNVPEPFSGNSPVHLNMPGGAKAQDQKYLSDWRQSTHQGARSFNESSISDAKKTYVQKRFCHSQSKEGDGVNTTPPLTKRQKLKQAVRDYGGTVIVFHVTISLASLGGCYLAISSGLDLPSLLGKLGVSEKFTLNQAAIGGSTFVVAYAVHKVFAPVRIAITLSTTPFLVRYLRGKGILKPPKNKKQ